MPEPHERRRDTFAARLVDSGLDAALVTDMVHVRYLTGFTGSAGVVLVAADGSAVLATDGRYEVQAGDEAPDVEVVITRTGRRALAERAVTGGVERLGFEDLDLSVAAFRDLPHSATWEPLGTTLAELRTVKDPAELDALRRACRVTDEALTTVLPRLVPGATEREVARWIDEALRDASEGPGFDTIVASGPNGAIPHHQPGERPLAAGDLVTLDFWGPGRRLPRRHDPDRAGRVSSLWVAARGLRRRGNPAQATGVAALSAGIAASEVDAAAREVIAAAGYGCCSCTGSGTVWGCRSTSAVPRGVLHRKLTVSVPVTVEPGVYLPGRGGVRIEDTVVVHAGRVESLTTSPRELAVGAPSGPSGALLPALTPACPTRLDRIWSCSGHDQRPQAAWSSTSTAACGPWSSSSTSSRAKVARSCGPS